MNGQTFTPGQANNAYIFPGVGLGLIAAGAKIATDEMFLKAAATLAKMVTPNDLAKGRLYPPWTQIREISTHIAKAIASEVYALGLGTLRQPPNLLKHIKSLQYDPTYKSYA